MIVVDTNLIVYLHVESDQTENAERVLSIDPMWCAPYLWRSEFRNVLTLYIRRGILTVAEVTQLMSAAERLFANREYFVASASVFDFVTRSTLSAYDCEFVALAAALGIPLVTGDRAIFTAFPDIAMAPKALIERARG